jgi:hypothetical protein
VREVLYGDGSVHAAHASLIGRSNTTLPVSTVDGHHCSDHRVLSQPDRCSTLRSAR